MKNRILYILSLMALLLLALSCADMSEEMDVAGRDGAITLHFRSSDVAVKGTVEDNDCESYMSHLDVVIYLREDSEYKPFHHERIQR